jgi:hypothetical protein
MRKEIKIQLEAENYDFLLELKKQNKDKNISDLINSNLTMLRELISALKSL